ncbi:MAG TPA: hypothetical protein VGM00_09100, partial [Bradyrhizobium sp.]
RDLLDQLRLRHLYGHFVSCGLIRPDDNIWKFPGKNRGSAIYTAFVGGFGRFPARPGGRKCWPPCFYRGFGGFRRGAELV